jgi:hypothetical protein
MGIHVMTGLTAFGYISKTAMTDLSLIVEFLV